MSAPDKQIIEQANPTQGQPQPASIPVVNTPPTSAPEINAPKIR